MSTVIECRSEYLFVIDHLVFGRKGEAHGRRLKFFRNKDYEVTEEFLQHFEYQELLVIESFLDIRQHQGQVELLVK